MRVELGVRLQMVVPVRHHQSAVRQYIMLEVEVEETMAVPTIGEMEVSVVVATAQLLVMDKTEPRILAVVEVAQVRKVLVGLVAQGVPV